MFTVVLYVIGGLMVMGGIVAALFGGVWLVFLPQLLVGGVLLIVGLAIERWRYKPILHAPPDARWRDTGERFVDPETGLLTAVYYDRATSERHYLAAGEDRPESRSGTG
ncbi:MAG: hypothetical protein U1F23_08710 [Lysobacterales bacterium]